MIKFLKCILQEHDMENSDLSIYLNLSVHKKKLFNDPTVKVSLFGFELTELIRIAPKIVSQEFYTENLNLS